MTIKEHIDSEKTIIGLIKECLDNKLWGNLSAIIEQKHPSDIASIIEQFQPNEKSKILKVVGPASAAKIFAELDESSEEEILDILDDDYLAQIFENMKTDDATDSISELSKHRRNEILSKMEKQESQKVEKLMQYEEESAGGIMTLELIALYPELTIKEAIDKLRKHLRDEPFHIYIINRENILLGIVPIRRLITYPPETQLKKIMNTELITADVDYDQEAVARMFVKYNLSTLPIIDKEGKLVGRVTMDDVVEIMQDEATEDILRLAGTDEEELTSKSIWKIAYLRAPWLFVCWIGELLSSAVILKNDAVLHRIIELASFLPIIIAMGGNVGSQAAYTVVRGLALGKVDFNSLRKVLWKEIRIALILGIIYGLGLAVYAQFKFGAGGYYIHLSAVLGFSLMISMLIASSVGSSIPIILHRLKIDPAIATGPFVTTIMDVIGIFSYFYIATRFLQGM